ncbi:MAG TPA: hypothetical protein VKD90_24400 [Gemmataceae bacterium]|nr:hypothetical protein [Gemmataceae bacterium]
MRTPSRRTLLTAAASGVVALGAARAARAADTPGTARPRVDWYATTPGSELAAALPLAHRPFKYTTLYSLKLPDLKRGDVVQAHSQFEVTNDLGVNVMLAHSMLLHVKETVVAHEDKPDGRVLCEYAGENITPGMHHGFRTLTGSIAVPDDGDAWLSVVLYAASTGVPPGRRLTVQKNYGSLRAIVFRNPA